MAAKAKETPKANGIGAVARQAMRDGKTNEEALAIVMKKFPDSNANLSNVAWYRGQMRAAGEKVLTNREARGDAPAAPRPKKAGVAGKIAKAVAKVAAKGKAAKLMQKKAAKKAAPKKRAVPADVADELAG